MDTKTGSPAAEFLKKGMVVRASLPSKSVLDRRLPEIFKSRRLGNRQIAQVTGYFRNKLGTLTTKFYNYLNRECIVVPVQLTERMYIVPPDKVLEVYDWTRAFREEYVEYEEQLRNFVEKGEVPEDARSNAKFDTEYLSVVQEYLARNNLDPDITVPKIADRVDIRFEEFKMGDQLFQMFAEKKYEELTRNLSKKERESLKSLEREVAAREQELMESARESVRERVQGILQEINDLSERIARGAKGPTRRKLDTLRAALAAAERLAGNAGVEADFSTARTVLDSFEEGMDRDYKEIRTRKRPKQMDSGTALTEALNGFATE